MLLIIHGEYNEYAQKQQIPIVSIDDRNTVNVCQMFYTLNDDGMITNTDITSKIAVIGRNDLKHQQMKTVKMF